MCGLKRVSQARRFGPCGRSGVPLANGFGSHSGRQGNHGPGSPDTGIYRFCFQSIATRPGASCRPSTRRSTEHPHTPAKTRQRRSLQAGKSPSGSGKSLPSRPRLVKGLTFSEQVCINHDVVFPPCCRNSATAAGRGRPRSPGELCRSSHWPKVCVRTRIRRRAGRHRHSVPRRQTGVRSRCYDLRPGGQPHSRLAVWLQPMPCRFAIRHTADPVQRPVL